MPPDIFGTKEVLWQCMVDHTSEVLKIREIGNLIKVNLSFIRNEEDTHNEVKPTWM